MAVAAYVNLAMLELLLASLILKHGHINLSSYDNVCRLKVLSANNIQWMISVFSYTSFWVLTLALISGRQTKLKRTGRQTTKLKKIYRIQDP